MTNEEAIKVLEQIRQWTDYPKEALTMAIEALSKPSFPSNLDEAAEKFGLEYAPIISGESLDLSGQFYETDDVDWPSRCGFIKGFKAGAEWQLDEDSKKHYFIQLKNIKDAWQELKKSTPEIESKPAVCFHRGAEWMAGQGWTLEGEIKDAPTGGDDFEIYLDYDYYKMEDILDEICDYVNANYPDDDNRYKVIVQIRKKQ